MFRALRHPFNFLGAALNASPREILDILTLNRCLSSPPQTTDSSRQGRREGYGLLSVQPREAL